MRESRGKSKEAEKPTNGNGTRERASEREKKETISSDGTNNGSGKSFFEESIQPEENKKVLEKKTRKSKNQEKNKTKLEAPSFRADRKE